MHFARVKSEQKIARRTIYSRLTLFVWLGDIKIFIFKTGEVKSYLELIIVFFYVGN